MYKYISFKKSKLDLIKPAAERLVEAVETSVFLTPEQKTVRKAYVIITWLFGCSFRPVMQQRLIGMIPTEENDLITDKARIYRMISKIFFNNGYELVYSQRLWLKGIYILSTFPISFSTELTTAQIQWALEHGCVVRKIEGKEERAV